MRGQPLPMGENGKGQRSWKVVVDSLDGTIEVLIANAHIIWVYFPTCVSAHARCSCANGGGNGFEAILKYLWKVKTWALIMCFFYKIS